MKGLTLIGCILLGCSAAGCTRPARSPSAISPRPPDEAALVEKTFAPGLQIREGFDTPAPGPDWRVGDELLFGVLLQLDGERQVRFLRATVKTPVLKPNETVMVVPPDKPPPSPLGTSRWITHPHVGRQAYWTFTAKEWRMAYAVGSRTGGAGRRLEYSSRQILVAVDVYDQQARYVETSFLLMPEAALRGGLYAMTAAQLELRRTLGDDYAQIVASNPEQYPHEVENWVQLFNTLLALSNILWDCPSLRPMLEAVQPKPSVLSLILHLGRLNLSLEPVPAALEAVQNVLPPTTEDAPALRLPLNVVLNDEAALRVDLLVVPPQPPLELCAGVIGIDVTRVLGPPAHLHVRLMAAHHGAAESRPAQ